MAKHEKILKSLKPGDLILVSGYDWSTALCNEWADTVKYQPQVPVMISVPGFLLKYDKNFIWFWGMLALYPHPTLPDGKYLHSIARDTVTEIKILSRVKKRSKS